MKNTLIGIGICIVSFSLYTCTSKSYTGKISKETEDSISKAIAKKERTKIIDSIKTKYGVSVVWDTVHYSKTLLFDALINSVGCIKHADVNDVYKKDSIYYTRVSADQFQFNLIITKAQADLLVQKKYEICTMIIRVANVKKIPLTLNTEIEKTDEEEDDENEDVQISFDASEMFICKGVLIDLIFPRGR
jgi:hypothetical protein